MVEHVDDRNMEEDSKSMLHLKCKDDERPTKFTLKSVFKRKFDSFSTFVKKLKRIEGVSAELAKDLCSLKKLNAKIMILHWLLVCY